MSTNCDIVIVGAKRSIIGSINGSLKYTSAAGLSSYVITSLLDELGERGYQFSRDLIKTIIVGQCIGAGTGQNLPRQIAVKSNLNSIESSFIINELCGSGLETVIQAAHAIWLEEYPVVIAGGVEVPSAAPYLITREQVLSWRDRIVEEIEPLMPTATLRDALWCSIHNVHTIVHAEDTTREWVDERGLDRESFKTELDGWAIESNRRAREAIENGCFADEIAVLPGTSADDELPAVKRMERLSRRRGTQFTPDGIFLSNHNSPAPANGAAYLVLMSRAAADKYSLPPLAKITGYAKAGVEPEKFLWAPVKAVEKLLEKTATFIEDYDLLELNTAFSSQMFFNKYKFNLDMDRVNIYGDCIAMGHPIGAAGSRLLTTLLYALERHKKKKGLVSICLGGGNGIALAVERTE